MLLVDQHKDAWIDENLFSLLLTDTMFVQALAAIAVIPIKPELAKVEHAGILP